MPSASGYRTDCQGLSADCMRKFTHTHTHTHTHSHTHTRAGTHSSIMLRQNTKIPASKSAVTGRKKSSTADRRG